jgi:KDO2-lipid IV(A) lauroyltransferase
MNGTRPPIRRRIEAALTRAAMAWVPFLSRGAVVRLSRAFGALSCALAIHQRRVGLANLDLAYGRTLTPREKRRILRDSFRTFALVMLDVFWFSHDTRARLDRWVEIEAASVPLLFNDRAQMLLTAHLGNWEILGQAIAHRGLRLMSVAAPLANPLVDELFLRMRTRSGQEIAAKEGALIKLMKRLRQGGKVAMLPDQNTKPSEGGAFVDFFSRPVPVSQAPAALAARSAVEIVFGYCLPAPDGRYIARLHDRLPAEDVAACRSPEAVIRLTQRITRLVEDAVREHPGAWLWTYKRWKYIPPWRKREEYPFYAKPVSTAEAQAPGPAAAAVK